MRSKEETNTKRKNIYLRTTVLNKELLNGDIKQINNIVYGLVYLLGYIV